MRLNIFALILILILSGCDPVSYQGTLKYQQPGINRCEAYYITMDNNNYMIDTSKIGDLKTSIGKQVRIKGKLVDRLSMRKCLFEKTIEATDIEIL